MNREETKDILKIILRAYPRMKVVETKEDVDLWHECLEDLEYQKARKATIDIVKKTMDFPPDIATIRNEYGKLLAKEKKVVAEINRFYEQARSYYPGSGEMGYGRKEFFERAKTPEQAERLYNAIVRYVNSCTERTMDFKACISTIGGKEDERV